MSTIKDVAKMAGVSISTVSYAINNTGNISGQTKKRILEAARELNYRPNGHARNLKTKKNNLIAVVLYGFDGYIWADIIRGVREIAKSNGYEIVIIECNDGNQSLHRVLSQGMVDGAIILSANVDNVTISKLASGDLPMVVLDRRMNSEHISNVLIDNEKAAGQAVQFMYEKGYRTIGMLLGPKDTYDSNKRFEGFKRAAKELGMENRACWNIQGNFNENDAYEAMMGLIDKGDLPRGFFCANDHMAIGAMRALAAASLQVPRDVGIIGFDDIILCRYMRPRITTMRRPSYESGIIAANNLIHTFKGEQVSRCVVLTPDFIVRESC